MTAAAKTSLVTGGTRGIGSEISEVLRDRGDWVITVSRREINDENHFSVDLSSKKQIFELVRNLSSTTIDNTVLVLPAKYNNILWFILI